MAPQRIKILFLSANPEGTGHLRLDLEVKEIDRALREGEYRDRFDLVQHGAVDVDDLPALLLRHRPHVVHFSGHGSPQGALMFEPRRGPTGHRRELDIGGAVERTGQPGQVSARALGRTFATLTDNVRCVVLNACYSETQARAIAEHVDVVIGMSRAIGDTAAIRFASAFYLGLGFGRDVRTAFELGCNAIDLDGLDEQDTPKLLANAVDPRELLLLPADADGTERPGAPPQTRWHEADDAPPRVPWDTGGLLFGVLGLMGAVVLTLLASLYVHDVPRQLRSAAYVAAVVAACAVVGGTWVAARGVRDGFRRVSQWLGRSVPAKVATAAVFLVAVAVGWTAGLPKIDCVRGVTCGRIFVEPFVGLDDAKRIIGQKLAAAERARVARPALVVYGQGQDRLTDEMLTFVNRIIGGAYVGSAVSAYVEGADRRLLSPVDVPADGVESASEWLELYTELTARLLAALGVHVDADLRDAIAAVPTTDVRAFDHKRRGDALVAIGQLDEAGVEFAQAIALDGAYADAHDALGMVRERQGAWEEAAASFERAIDILPGYVVFEYNLGNLLRQYAPPERVNDAADVLEGVVERDPTFVAARAALGATYLDLGRLDDARDVLEDGLRLAPEHAPLHNGIGLVEILSGRPTEAVAWFETANRFDPTYAPAYLNHAEALIDLGRWQDAAAVYERAAAERPGDAVFEYRLGALYAQQDVPDEAVRRLEEALRIAPNLVEARHALGEVLVDLGDLDTARYHVHQGLILAPDYAPLYNTLGVIDQAAGEPGLALERFEMATQLDASYGEALQNRAHVLFVLGHDEEAIQVQERANQVIGVPVDPLDRFVIDGPTYVPLCWADSCP